MSYTRPLQSHRFVVVFRPETRENAAADEIWRGWVERIPDPRQRAEAGQADERLGFQSLDELPGLINRLMESADRAAATDRRNSQ